VAEQWCDVFTCFDVMCVADGGCMALFHGVTCVFGYGWSPTVGHTHRRTVEKCDTGSHLLPLTPRGVFVRALCLCQVTRRARLAAFPGVSCNRTPVVSVYTRCSCPRRSTSSGVGGDDMVPLVATLQHGDGDEKHAYTCAASPDGKVWVTAGQGGVIKVWDAATRACVHYQPMPHMELRSCDVSSSHPTVLAWPLPRMTTPWPSGRCQLGKWSACCVGTRAP